MREDPGGGEVQGGEDPRKVRILQKLFQSENFLPDYSINYNFPPFMLKIINILNVYQISYNFEYDSTAY